MFHNAIRFGFHAFLQRLLKAKRDLSWVSQLCFGSISFIDWTSAKNVRFAFHTSIEIEIYLIRFKKKYCSENQWHPQVIIIQLKIFFFRVSETFPFIRNKLSFRSKEIQVWTEKTDWFWCQYKIRFRNLSWHEHCLRCLHPAKMNSTVRLLSQNRHNFFEHKSMVIKHIHRMLLALNAEIDWLEFWVCLWFW